MRLEIVVFSFLFAVATATNIHIVKGKPSTPNSKPWLLPLWPQKDGFNLYTWHTSYCSCSLIQLSPNDTSSDICLTAAHCIGTRPSFRQQPCHNKPHIFRSFVVTVGAHDIPLKGKKVTVANGQCHDGWVPPRENSSVSMNDIAVLKLAEKIAFSETVRGIDLSDSGDELVPGDRCNVAGWGAEKFINEDKDRPEYSGPLKELDTKILDNKVCSEYNGDGFAAEKMLCDTSITQGGSACLGDSGGALVCDKNGKPVIFGVLSNGGDCWVNDIPSPSPNYYAKVAYYRKWIDAEIKKLRGKNVIGI